MNDFDFYTVQATSKRIRPLLRMGVARKHINERISYSGRWPDTTYSAQLASVDVMHIGHHNASAKADELAKGFKAKAEEGVTVTVRFFPVD